MKVLYITFIDFDKALSGSSVRPQKMYQAFIDCGCEVKLLKGEQNKRKQRKKNVRDVISWLDSNKPDICYIEPPSGPFFNMIDHRLIKKVHNMRVPIGLFYRDAYWKYGLTKKGIGIKSVLKDSLIKILQAIDLRRFYKYCNIIYTPTELAGKEWRIKNYKRLSPGCDIVSVRTPTNEIPIALYIGGVSDIYGTYKMLDAFRRINNDLTHVRLNMICRTNEWENISAEYKELANTDWLCVQHLSGEALVEHYHIADFAIHPLKKMAYNDTAMPIKIMEYLSYCKPMIVTNCVEMSRFIADNEIGFTFEYSVESIIKAILKMAGNKELCKELIQNCYKAREQNVWKRRAEQVIEELTYHIQK